MPHIRFRALLAASLLAGAVLVSTTASAGSARVTAADELAQYWTPERVASAQPRDLVIDGRGLAYVRGRGGSLTPHGHAIPARLEQVATRIAAAVPMAKPGGGGGDTTPPSVTGMTPGEGATIGAQATFSATVTDSSGVRSVTVVIHLPSGQTQSFAASNQGSNVWATTISGFSDGDGWAWHIVAKDNASRGGNTTTSPTLRFSVGTSGGGGGGGGVVTNAPWNGGDVQLAAGRILFEMPTVKGTRVTWNAYVCSGTVVSEGKTGASIILTAAHCVYDDVAKQFARNVLFIPNQDATTAAGTDWNCANDPIGCWAPSYGVVDANWTTRTFPDNVEWDYAYYVVPSNGAHTAGSMSASDSLEDAVPELSVPFTTPATGEVTHALGYSYSDDPNFMYCAEAMGAASAVNWWLGNCDLSGGSSGGPWVQPMDPEAGSGPIISVNSWGYTTQPGMAGPKLDGSAQCTYGVAVQSTGPTTSPRGVIAGC